MTVGGIIPVQFLRLLCNLQFLSFLFYITTHVSLDTDGIEPAAPEGDRSQRGIKPKSLMFQTPVVLELALRFFAPSLGGLDDRP